MLCGHLRETTMEGKIYNKILRSLPERFYPTVTSIEEHKDPENMKVEDLVGSLQIYELKNVTLPKRNPLPLNLQSLKIKSKKNQLLKVKMKKTWQLLPKKLLKHFKSKRRPKDNKH